MPSAFRKKPLPIADLSYAESTELLTSTRKSLGLSFIPCIPEPDLVIVLMDAFWSKTKAPRWVWRWQSFRRVRPLFFTWDSSLYSRPSKNSAPESINRPAQPRIRVEKNWSRRRQDGDLCEIWRRSLQPTPPSMGNNIGTHAWLFHL